MGLGGGNYQDYNKFFPGTYSNTRTLGAVVSEPTRGVVAGGLMLDWGPENQVFEIDVEDFNENAKKITGYAYDAPENIAIRELFKHAIKLVGYKLNNTGSAKAVNAEVGEAKYSGSVGNKIAVTCYKNVNDDTKYDVSTYFDGELVDLQTVKEGVKRTVSIAKGSEAQEEGLGKPTATIEFAEKVATVTYSNLTNSYKTTQTKVTLDGADATDKVTIANSKNTDTVTFKDESADGKYKIEAIVKNDSGEIKTLKTIEITKKTTAETVKLTKGAETAGEKVGSETVTTDIQGLVATLTYSELPSTYNKLAVQVTKDGEPYSEKVTVDNTTGLANKKATVTFAKDAPKGEYKIEARLQKQDGTEDYKTTSTITVTLETDKPKKIDYTKGTEKEVDKLEAPKVTFKQTENKISATFVDSYVDYPSYLIEVEYNGAVTSTGIILENNQTIQDVTFTDMAENGEHTIKAYLTGAESEKKQIAHCPVTVTINEAGLKGADVKELKDNDYVCFNKTSVITESAGYVFNGGLSSQSVTVDDHQNCLNAIENFSFNTLFGDTTDETVKELYSSYTKRLRYEKGKYHQLYLWDYAQADDEGIVAIYNQVTNSDDYANINKSALVYWLAGYGASIELKNELTNKPYDGELSVFTDIADAKIQMLVKNGNFIFHQVGIDQVNTLFDYNTKTTFTDEKDEQMRENKVIRTIDDIHNREAYDINRLDIGTTPTTPEGLTLIWNRCATILKDEQSQGAIQDLDTNKLKVENIKDKPHMVKISQCIHVADTVYQVYIDSLITRNV